MKINFVSLFSGIEAFSVAASRIADVDWRPVFFSEIDPFPCAVLAHRFPSVPNLGDVTKIRVEERDNPETNTKEKVITNGSTTIPFPRMGIDILAGGSPCQDVSVAGLRRGMQRDSGTRSSLAFEYARLVEELHPRIILWENVPGVLSSRNGLDFRAFLGSLVERGYCCAWRVLDAQFTPTHTFPFAVPQRRRRVWLVGCLGTDESVPAQILSLVEGLRGDPPPRRETGKGAASPAGYRADRDDRVVEGAGFGETGVGYWQPGCQTLRAEGENRPSRPGNVAVTPCGAGAGADRGGRGDDAGEAQGTPRTIGISIGAGVVVMDKEAYNSGENQTGGLGIQEDNRTSSLRATGHAPAVAVRTANTGANGHGFAEEATHTLDRANGQAVAYPINSMVIGKDVKDGDRQTTGIGDANDPCPTLQTAHHHAVAIGFKAGQSANGGLGIEEDVCPTQIHQPSALEPTVALHHIVRRLTVVECSRLQGFPDWWVRIPVDKWRKIDEDERDYLAGLGPWYRSHIRETGKPGVWETDLSSDSPAYKALGNSWATNCAEWILRRLVASDVFKE